MQLPTATRPPDHPRNGPLVTRRNLMLSGHNSRSILRLLKKGALIRVRDGVYVAPETWSALDDEGRYGLLCRAVLAQAQTRLVLSHISGLQQYDVPLWGYELDLVHVTRTDGGRGRVGPHVRQHRGRIRDGDLTEVNGVPVMTPARLAVETITLGHPEASLAVLNHVLHHKLATRAELDAQHVAMQTWPGMLPAEILLRLADGRIESVGESRTFWILYQHGLPAPEPQYEVRDRHGRLVAQLDFAWPDLKVWLEFDGKVKYEKLLRDGDRASDVVVREKQREDLVRQLTGWRCLRIVWADLKDPVWLAAKIRRFLAGELV